MAEMNPDKWMYHALAKAMGRDCSPNEVFPVRMQFVDLYREATYGQRTAFFQQTKFAQLHPDRIPDAATRDAPFQAIPPHSGSRSRDITYFMRPRED